MRDSLVVVYANRRANNWHLREILDYSDALKRELCLMCRLKLFMKAVTNGLIFGNAKISRI